MANIVKSENFQTVHVYHFALFHYRFSPHKARLSGDMLSLRVWVILQIRWRSTSKMTQVYSSCTRNFCRTNSSSATKISWNCFPSRCFVSSKETLSLTYRYSSYIYISGYLWQLNIAMITSLLRQNDNATSFWLKMILLLCSVNWVLKLPSFDIKFMK